jgi:hypothetical protein
MSEMIDLMDFQKSTIDHIGEVNQLVRRAVTAMTKVADVSAVVLHGSQLSTARDQWSDIDLILILNSGYVPSKFRVIDSISIDITSGTAEALSTRLNRDHPTNSNLILRALYHGQICIDHDGKARRLTEEALYLIRRGPLSASRQEIAASKLKLLRLIKSAERLTFRGGYSAESSLLASMRCDRLAVESLYTYHRMRRKWADGLRRLIDNIKMDNPDLYHLWSKYVGASHLQEKLRYAITLAEAAHSENQ